MKHSLTIKEIFTSQGGITSHRPSHAITTKSSEPSNSSDFTSGCPLKSELLEMTQAVRVLTQLQISEIFDVLYTTDAGLERSYQKPIEKKQEE